MAATADPLLVLVTEHEYRRAEATFSAAPGLDCRCVPEAEADLVAAIAATGARHVIVSHVPYRQALYDALPRGGVLARFGVGHDNIDKARATAAGLLCTNTPGVLDQSVAEVTMMLIGLAARRLDRLAAAMRAGQWAPETGTELEGRTLLIVGCGRIGQATGRIAARGFGMRVVGYRRPRPGGSVEPPPADFAAVTDDFARAARDADFVSLHIPASPENARFLNAERLGLLAPHAWLINTARGAVVDEAALYDALAAGRLGGAVLDVFDREPYVPVDPSRDLRTRGNVVLTPHIGSNTAACNRRMAERAIRNVRLGAAGEYDRMDLLNPDVLHTLRPGR